MKVTSSYGWRVHPITKQRQFHTGVDIDGETGDPVQAIEAGRVMRLDVAGVGAGVINGNAVHVWTGDRLWSYLHLDRPSVKVGELVRKGQVIGLLGNTGRSTGSHLHLQVEQDGKTVDPLPLMRRAGNVSTGGATWSNLLVAAAAVAAFVYVGGPAYVAPHLYAVGKKAAAFL